MTSRSFPSDFLWGVAAAGHQVEGDNTGSDTWFAEQVTPSVFMEPSGKACNGYELWREDIDLAKGMGLNAYRFSVEWARVEPTEGKFSEDELDHYEAIVDRCLEVGMAPVVTFNHFTSPHWFAMRGSWLDPEAPALFARYCDRVMERFGDRIAIAVTMNEPNLTRLLSWIDLPSFIRDVERATLEAATVATGVPAYRLANVMLPEEMDAFADGMAAGHVAAKAAIKARRADLPVGLSLAIVDDVVDGDDAVRARPQAGRGLRALAGAWPATTTSSGCRTTSASPTTATAPSRPRPAYPSTRWAARSSRSPWAAPSATPTRPPACRSW